MLWNSHVSPCKHRWRCAGFVIRISQFDSGTGLQLRASEPVSCWPHKPCEWRSTRQPATNFWGSRSTEGPLACNQQMRVQLPPLPPSSPGRPLRSRRRSENPDKHVRLVLLAPSVTVAEWLRRQTVDLSTRVQFPPVTPIVRVSSNGEDTSVLTKKCRFD